MVIVIFAGGSGTRLWPLSTPAKPKHLLELTNAKSLLQNTYERARLLSKDIYITSVTTHVAVAKAQLPQVPASHFIIEPARRGTASAILLALHQIKQHHPVEEPIVFLSADHHITDTASLNLAISTAAQAAQTEAKIALVGVEPHYPATGFGYIKKGRPVADTYRLPVYRVAKFKEKPNRPTAQKYLDSGDYLWNMGLFAATAAVFETNIKKYAPAFHKHYQQLQTAKNRRQAYINFPDQSIDYALIEKTPDCLVVPGTFAWADVGSFHDLHGVSKTNQHGNVHLGKGKVMTTRNSYVRNETDTPALVIGLDNIVVVNTPDGLLVCHRDYAQNVGDAIKLYWQQETGNDS